MSTTESKAAEPAATHGATNNIGADAVVVPGPLNAAEMAEYQRLTALLDDNCDRRLRLVLMRAGLAKDAARLAALDARKAELEASGCAIARLRQHLHGRYKWPKIYRGSVPAAQ